tara:strand:- start:224 stop:1069 length:846 start_codon:yes stop_codon:yes gene_type:complete
MVSENIIISNPKKLEEIKKKIKHGGKDKLHVIADFDRTLTKSLFEGKKSSTVIAQIRNGNYLSQDYRDRAYALFDEYHPVEISTTISLNEKKKKMKEWWEKHFNLLVDSGINRKIIKEIIKDKKVPFRKGTLEFLKNLNEKNIPLVIMSAGPGDMIKEHLKSENISYNNIHIVANFFKFQGDKIIGIKEPIIHTFNKKEISIKELPVYDDLLKRKNVLLLGDHIADVEMIKGFPYETTIKIGFLNSKIEKSLNDFKKNYDVVILKDGTMDYVNKLVKEIIE